MTVGFVCGAFDYLHCGHILMMAEAKGQCDYLIVGLQLDPTIDRPEKEKPEQDIFERSIQLDAVRFVDKVIVYITEDNLRDYLLANKYTIDKRFVDESYRDRGFTGKSITEIEVIYNSRKHDYSSSKIRGN